QVFLDHGLQHRNKDLFVRGIFQVEGGSQLFVIGGLGRIVLKVAAYLVACPLHTLIQFFNALFVSHNHNGVAQCLSMSKGTLFARNIHFSKIISMKTLGYMTLLLCICFQNQKTTAQERNYEKEDMQEVWQAEGMVADFVSNDPLIAKRDSLWVSE